MRTYVRVCVYFIIMTAIFHQLHNLFSSTKSLIEIVIYDIKLINFGAHEILFYLNEEYE